MDDRRTLVIAVVVMVVGLANAAALYGGLNALSATLDRKIFSQSGPSITNESAGSVVPLSGDRFAVVTDLAVSVYIVGANGALVRLAHVDPRFNPPLPKKRKLPSGE